ncbi:MAG: TRAP transporter substrate-binding protein [Alphaproteobacteria bacterium]
MAFRKAPTIALGALLVGAALALAPGVSVAQEVTLKLHHFLPTSSTTHAGFLKPWADKVMAESQGRIRIDIYPSMQIGGRAPQLYDQVKDGVVDLAWTLPGYTAGRFPLVEVFELPFVTGSAEATSQALMAFYDKYLEDEFRDVKVIALHAHAPGALHMATRPVRVLEDFDGVKIRAPSRTVNAALKALGATPVGMPVPQVPEAIARGVVEGAALPYEVTLPLRIHEITRYHTNTGLYTAVFLFAMNRDRYESLPADLKAVIDANSGIGVAAWAGRVWDAAEAPGIAAAEARGNAFYTLDAAEVARWKAVTRPVIDDWIAATDARGLDGQALYDEAKALVARYGE